MDRIKPPVRPATPQIGRRSALRYIAALLGLPAAPLSMAAPPAPAAAIARAPVPIAAERAPVWLETGSSRTPGCRGYFLFVTPGGETVRLSGAETLAQPWLHQLPADVFERVNHSARVFAQLDEIDAL